MRLRRHPPDSPAADRGTKFASVPRAATAERASAEEKTVPRVGYLVYRVERRLRARLDEEMRHHGLSTPEYVALSVLRERDGLSCAQLARWALVTPQAMNLVISGLERRKLVRRRPDPGHRRVLRASVTPKGLAVMARCDHSMDRIEADMLGDMAPETVEVVRAALGSFAHSLGVTSPPPRPRPLGRTR
jgi:DNA-binding MarR family transcriptional regulator